MSVGVVIVAGGKGARVGGDIPKQLLDLGGRSMLARSVAAFDAHPRVSEFVVVLPNDLVDRGRELIGAVSSSWNFAAGGARRQDSVQNGLKSLSADVSVVLIHDAARPFITPALIERVIDAAAKDGAAVPA